MYLKRLHACIYIHIHTYIHTTHKLVRFERPVNVSAGILPAAVLNEAENVLYVCMYVCMCVYVNMSAGILLVVVAKSPVRTYVCLSVCMYVHVCMYAGMLTSGDDNVLCIHTYIHTYMHTCMHTYTHTHRHDLPPTCIRT